MSRDTPIAAPAPVRRPLRACARILARRLVLPVLLTTLAAASATAVGATLEVCKSGCLYATVQSAIDAAKSGDKITVAGGTYFENLRVEGKTLTIVGAGEDQTVIDGGYRASTLRLGPAIGAPAAVREFANVTVYAVNLTHGANSAILVTGGSLDLENSALVSNQSVSTYPASSQFGGGISANSAQVTVGSCVLAHNKSSVGGGAIAAMGESRVVVAHSTIARNTSADGGGVFVDATSSVSITGTTLADNTANGLAAANGLADGGTGGAIFVAGRDATARAPGGILSVDASSLVNNAAAGDGGGIEGFASVSNSVVARNTAGRFGGGIAGGAALTEVFIVENSAAANGGGVYVSSLQQTASTIAGNLPDDCVSTSSSACLSL